jgi:hypothetical protein
MCLKWQQNRETWTEYILIGVPSSKKGKSASKRVLVPHAHTIQRGVNPLTYSTAPHLYLFPVPPPNQASPPLRKIQPKPELGPAPFQIRISQKQTSQSSGGKNIRYFPLSPETSKYPWSHPLSSSICRDLRARDLSSLHVDSILRVLLSARHGFAYAGVHEKPCQWHQ